MHSPQVYGSSLAFPLILVNVINIYFSVPGTVLGAADRRDLVRGLVELRVS